MRIKFIKLFEEAGNRDISFENLNSEEFTGHILKTYKGNELNALLLMFGNSKELLYSKSHGDYLNKVKNNIIKVLSIEYINDVSLINKANEIKDIAKDTGYEEDFLELISNINHSLYCNKVKELNKYFKECVFNENFSFEIPKVSQLNNAGNF